MATSNGIFASAPILGMVTMNGANTARDGSGSNLFTLYTATQNSIIEGLVLNNSNVTGNTWQNRVIRVFIGNSGTNYLYFETLPKYLETPSDTARTKPMWVDFNPLPLESGQSIMISQSLYSANADLVSATVYGYKI